MDINRLEDCTLLIAGPISSRTEEAELISKIQNLSNISRATGLKVLISTYPGEFPKFLEFPTLQIMTVVDPGADFFLKDIKVNSFVSRNTSRLLLSTWNGVNNVTTPFTLKTRIEMVPTDYRFGEGIWNLKKEFLQRPSIQISVPGANYQGVKKFSKGVFLWIPDTVQFMRTDEMKVLWGNANELWSRFSKEWTQYVKQPITNEQIVGLALAKMNGCLMKDTSLMKFKKYTLNRNVYNIVKFWEINTLRTFTSKSLYLPKNRLTFAEKRFRAEVTLPAKNLYLKPFLFCYFLQKSYLLLLYINVSRSRIRFLTKSYWTNIANRINSVKTK